MLSFAAPPLPLPPEAVPWGADAPALPLPDWAPDDNDDGPVDGGIVCDMALLLLFEDCA